MNTAEHFMCTDIEWDPTGRYVATSVTHIHQMENGFNIWSFHGNLLYRCAFCSCCATPVCGVWHSWFCSHLAARQLLPPYHRVCLRACLALIC